MTVDEKPPDPTFNGGLTGVDVTQVRRDWWEDYEVGIEFRSPGRTITESDLVTWSSLVGDWTPLHTDSVYASSTAFGQRIAHGNIALNVSVGLLESVGYSTYLPSQFLGFESWRNVRFIKPVLIGDTLSCSASLVASEPNSDTVGTIVYQLSVRNQRGDEVVAAEQWLRVRRRPFEKLADPGIDAASGSSDAG